MVNKEMISKMKTIKN